MAGPFEEGRGLSVLDERSSVARWRETLAARGTLSREDLDELESHLLDHVDALADQGVDRAEAFARATAALGDVQAIAEEFAKVNPLLAWRSALFWIGAGVLTVLGLRPVQELAMHAVISACLALRVPAIVVTVVVWAVAFASPLVFFAGAFAWVRSKWRARFRMPAVVAIVGSAVTMIAAHLGSDWGWLGWLERRRFDYAALDDAWGSHLTASYALAVVAPIALAAFALRQRARGHAPSFWLAVGFFVGTVRWEMHLFVRFLTFAGAGDGHLDPAQTHALVWIVTLASPALLAAGTYTFLRHCAPAPARVANGRGIVVSLVVGTALAIGAVFATRIVGRHAMSVVSDEVHVAGVTAWLLASIVTSALLPIAVGALTFRLRDDANRI